MGDKVAVGILGASGYTGAELVRLLARHPRVRVAALTADVVVDTFPDRIYRGSVDSISAGTGSRFSILPPENASGNWVKVVQRVPVKIVLSPSETTNPHTLRAGMSVGVTVHLR